MAQAVFVCPAAPARLCQQSDSLPQNIISSLRLSCRPCASLLSTSSTNCLGNPAGPFLARKPARGLQIISEARERSPGCLEPAPPLCRQRASRGPLPLGSSVSSQGGRGPVPLEAQQHIQADACCVLVYNGSLAEPCLAGEQPGPLCQVPLASRQTG
jgi:hypothetical protein